VASIATSKSGVIDRMSVTTVTAITPCVGGLVIWYPDHEGERPVPEQQGSDDAGTDRREKRRQ
jgi:hypothetical protein